MSREYELTNFHEPFDARRFMWQCGLALAVIIFVVAMARGDMPPPKDYGPSITTTDGAKYERGTDGRYYRIGTAPPAKAAPVAAPASPVAAPAVQGCVSGQCPAPSSSPSRRGLLFRRW